jgi:GxxExxY protein
VLELEAVSRAVIEAAMRVHRTLGPGFLEKLYEEAMAVELAERGVHFDRQLSVPVLYRGREIGLHRLDLLVEGAVVVQLKAVQTLLPIHRSIVLSYLRATSLRVGLLLNFRDASLRPERILNPRAKPT